jgi:hypothetical protein
MKYMKLLHACSEFNKGAQQKAKQVTIDPKKSNIEFWGKFLHNAIISYAHKFPNQQYAKKVFDAVARYKQAPAYNADTEFKDLTAIDAALEEASEKLRAVGLNPIDVLKSRGMQNVNPEIINILRRNLAVILEVQDFSRYQHFYLVAPGSAHPKDLIDLDADTSAGY